VIARESVDMHHKTNLFVFVLPFSFRGKQKDAWT